MSILKKYVAPIIILSFTLLQLQNVGYMSLT